VIIAEELTPADTAQLDPRRVVAIATQFGGAQSHTAIMAQALGLPAVLGAPGLMAAIKSGDQILVDGDLGQIVVNPSEQSVLAFQRRSDERLQEKKRLNRLAKQRAVTRDGIEISLQANVELPLEMANVAQVGASGIGLLRSEFMFMNRPTMPGEDEQFEAFRSLVEQSDGYPVTIRTADFGGNKSAAHLVGDFGESAASTLGLRGIRLSLARPEFLETQFRAILRAAAYGDVRVLLPMVTTVSEIRTSREILARAARRLHRRNIPIPIALPPLGSMIEVPGAALAADALAQVSDFFAIGSNDLTMYTLAIDRGDERVAHLYNPLHPGVLRLIQFAVAAALRARIPVSVCGEIAGDPRYTGLMLGLGLRELSMTATNIPRVKKRILDLDLVAASRRAQTIMEQMDPMRIQTLVEQFNEAD
jgi:phosphotransferase system enzyme I (PtsI)